MTTHCTHCGVELQPGSPRLGFEGEDLCQACNEHELLALLSECDAEERAKLRRRVEDLLRKSPVDMLSVAAKLAAAGKIRIDDVT